MQQTAAAEFEKVPSRAASDQRKGAVGRGVDLQGFVDVRRPTVTADSPAVLTVGGLAAVLLALSLADWRSSPARGVI